jgi:hypothetical protein
MESSPPFKHEHLVKSYENREAIYVEKGAIRVRVSQIHIDTCNDQIHAEIEEIFSPGLGAGMFYRPVWNEGTPVQWKIVGDLAACRVGKWSMGYGGWSLYFAPVVVEGITALAAQWPVDLGHWDRYTHVTKWLNNYIGEHAPFKRLAEE